MNAHDCPRQKADRRSYTPALGHRSLTPLYDAAIALATRESVWRSRLIDAIALQQGERLLDVGCGTGSLLATLAERTPDALFVGLDPDDTVLKRAKRRTTMNVSLVRGFLDSKFASTHDRFDVVVSSLVLHQAPLEVKRSMLAVMREVLSPGGRLCIADYGRQSGWLMRLLFRMTVQALDGQNDTQPNADGVLPTLMSDAGFSDIKEVAVICTPTGAIAVWHAR